jgi:hypothetical protein
MSGISVGSVRSKAVTLGDVTAVPDCNTLLGPRRWGKAVEGRYMGFAKENGPEFAKEGTLERLGEKIGKHVGGWTMDNADVMTFGVIGDEEVSDVDVAGALAARSFAIHFHFDGAFVVLVEDGRGGGKTLSGQKHFDVKGIGEVVTGANEFGLGGAFSVDVLLFGFAKKAAAAEGDDAASVAAHVRVNGKGSINPGGKRM